MTVEQKRIRSLEWLLYQTNRFMWTDKTDGPRLDKAFRRLMKAWLVAEARSKAAGH